MSNHCVCVLYRTIMLKDLLFLTSLFYCSLSLSLNAYVLFVLIWDSKANNIMRSFWIYSRLSFPWYVKSGLMLDGRRKEKSHCVSSTRQMLTIRHPVATQSRKFQVVYKNVPRCTEEKESLSNLVTQKQNLTVTCCYIHIQHWINTTSGPWLLQSHFQ